VYLLAIAELFLMSQARGDRTAEQPLVNLKAMSLTAVFYICPIPHSDRQISLNASGW